MTGESTAAPDQASPHIARRIVVHQSPAFVAMLFIAGIYTIIARDSGFGAVVLVPVVLATLVLLRVMATWRGHHRRERQIAIVLLGAITVAEVIVTFLIVNDILRTSTRLTDVSPPEALTFLRDATLVWLMNILCFAVWFWELDGDGPTRRYNEPYTLTDLLFPQLTVPSDQLPAAPWKPHFVDYLFVSFNNSATFGPADTSVLSRRMKLLTMVQTTTSMAILVIIVAWGLSVL